MPIGFGDFDTRHRNIDKALDENMLAKGSISILQISGCHLGVSKAGN
jgi:hypothetical protein